MAKKAVVSTESAGVDCDGTVESLEAFAAQVSAVRAALAALESTAAHQDDDPLRHATHFRNKVRPAMNALRATVDEIESQVAADLWPMPTYRDLLWLKGPTRVGHPERSEGSPSGSPRPVILSRMRRTSKTFHEAKRGGASPSAQDEGVIRVARPHVPSLTVLKPPPPWHPS